MLRYVNLIEIQNMLLQISELTNLQDLRDFSYVAKTKRWLSDLEKILENNHMVEAGEIASLRGKIVSAENGIFHDGVEFLNKPTKRKMVEAATSAALQDASKLIVNAINEELSRFREAERVVRQLISIGKAKGLLANFASNGNHTEALKFIWRTLAQDADISPGVVTVEGMVGPYDALILLDRLLSMDVVME